MTGQPNRSPQLGGHRGCRSGPGSGDAAGRRHDRGGLRQAAGRRWRRAGTRSRPCNVPARPAREAGPRRACGQAGGFPIEFVTIAVSDGISMGHEGMRASLVSREIIADSVELRDARRTVRRARRRSPAATRPCPGCSWPGPPQSAARVSLRRLDPARAATRASARRSRASSRRSARREGHDRPRTSCSGWSAGVSRPRGSCAGDVHREHDGLGRGGDRHVAAGQRVAARSRPPPRRLAYESGQARHEAPRAGTSAPARS